MCAGAASAWRKGMNTEKKKITVRLILIIQLSVMVYTLSGVVGKFAAGYSFLSLPFVALYGLEILILGGYAIVWQQIIKRVDLSVAYANRSLALLWSMLWSALIFQESISAQNLIGVAVVIAGVMLVNSNGKEEKDEL